MNDEATHLQLVLSGQAEPETTAELHALLLAKADARSRKPEQRALLMEAISGITLSDYHAAMAECAMTCRH